MRIVASDVTKSYGTHVVLASLSVQIETGRITAIVGPSGSGKSTLLAALGGIEEIDQGRISLEGCKSKLREVVSWAPQGANSLPNRSVVDNAALGALSRGCSRRVAESTARDKLALMGIGHCGDNPASTLSGGELARLAIARALAMQRPFLLADEPTGALDAANTLTLVSLMRRLAEEGVGVVLATHDPKVSECADVTIDLGIT